MRGLLHLLADRLAERHLARLWLRIYLRHARDFQFDSVGCRIPDEDAAEWACMAVKRFIWAVRP